MALDPLPDPIYLLELRSTRTAALELLLLAVAGGTLGAFVVLRRLAFYTHAVGTATFPGVVVAEAARFSPRLAALAVAVAYAGGVERAGRSGRDPGADATGLMLVLALAGGTILASDVFASGRRRGPGAVRQRGRAQRRRPGGGRGRRGRGRRWPPCCSGAPGPRWPSIPTAPPASASRRGVADLALLVIVGVTAVAALPAVGSLLVTSLFVVPAAIARLVTGSVAGLVAASVGVAAALGLLGLYGSIWLDVPPGPGDRRAGRRLLRGGGRRAAPWARPRGRARCRHERGAGGARAGGGLRRRARCSPGVSFAAPAGSSVCVLGPNGGGKTTLFRALTGQLAPVAGSFDIHGPAGPRGPGRPRAAGLPGQCPGRRGHGLAGRALVAAGPAPGPRRGPRTRSSASGCPGSEHTAFGALSGGQRQRVLIARALVQDAAVLLLDEPLAGVDPASAETIQRPVRRARGRGPDAAGVLARRGGRARLRRRAVPEPLPGGLRRPRHRAGRARAGDHLRPRADRDPRKRRRRRRRGRWPSSTTSTDGRPPDRTAGVGHRPPRACRGGAAGPAVRAAQLLGAQLPAGLPVGVAGPRAAARPGAGRAGGRAAARGRRGRRRRGRGGRGAGRAATTGSARTPPPPWWSAAAFGLGVLLALRPDAPARLGELLFGDPLGVSDADLAAAAALVVAGGLALAALHRPLAAVAFDAGGAGALGRAPRPRPAGAAAGAGHRGGRGGPGAGQPAGAGHPGRAGRGGRATACARPGRAMAAGRRRGGRRRRRSASTPRTTWAARPGASVALALCAAAGGGALLRRLAAPARRASA